MALHANFSLPPRWSPDDIVVGFIRAGDMHLINVAVVDEIASFLCTTLHHRKKTMLDGLGKSLLDVGAEIGIDGVHLEQNDFALVEHLGDEIHRRDRGNVSGAKYQYYPTIVIRLFIEAGAIALLWSIPYHRPHL